MPPKTELDGLQEAIRRIEEAKVSGAVTLDLSDLNLSGLPDSLARLANLQNLKLSNNQIRALPDSIAQLANLQYLDLSNNQISAIPDSIAQLANLQALNLWNNQISAIPDFIAQLANLQDLYLWSNQISAIPDSLAQLANLQDLDLSNNQISAIPDSLAQLANLQNLDLSNNQISAIPDSLAQLANLQTLDLADNAIRFIPDSLAQLSNLQYLNLADTQISAIPDSFGQMSGLIILYLHGNPRLGIPEEVLGRQDKPTPAAEILRYYFAQRSGSKPLNEAKLILVGTGGVGKSSLVKTLTTGKFNTRQKTTEGIKISDWRCPLSPTEKVTLHIWDFGGQEMMHATHQFFLTARSLYLLVLSRRQGGYDEEADYWFRMIRAFGGKDAPVIVVLNKQNDEPFDVNRGGWLEKYADNIKGFVQTDCADATSMTRLTEAIQKQLRLLKSLKATFPTRWFAIKDELANIKSDYVTFDDYRAMCSKHGENDPDAQNSLSGFLHDLGIALNYKTDPRLRFAYVLKPEWVTEGIYALLHAFVRTKGLFSPADAEKVLDKKKYPMEAVHFILGLMEQFELSFPLNDAKKRILIPELLDDQQPPMAAEFKLAECLNFGYRYPIVPGGLLPRFIVRTHHLSKSETRWKSGVILIQDSGCRALVRTDAVERRVRIHVDGPEGSRRDLLAIVRHNFDVIHSDYEFTPEDLVFPEGAPDKALNLGELEALRRGGDVTTSVVLQDKTVIKPNIAGLIQSVQSPITPLRLFLSYSHKDEKYLLELHKDLKLMERNGLIKPWYDRQLSAGEKWERRILQELNEADVIVCQLSRDFLASDFCVLTELETAIKRKEAGEAELIAYVLKDCGWQEVANLREFQILPQDGKSLHGWPNKSKYWLTIAEGIKKAIVKLQQNRSRIGQRDRKM
jgi:internalin A